MHLIFHYQDFKKPTQIQEVLSLKTVNYFR